MDPKEITRTLFDAFVTDDLERLKALVRADTRFQFSGEPGLIPWAGAFTGEDIWRALGILRDHLDFREVTIRDCQTAGHCVFVRVVQLVCIRAADLVHSMEIMGELQIDDGAILSYREFCDTAALGRALAGVATIGAVTT